MKRKKTDILGETLGSTCNAGDGIFQLGDAVLHLLGALFDFQFGKDISTVRNQRKQCNQKYNGKTHKTDQKPAENGGLGGGFLR